MGHIFDPDRLHAIAKMGMGLGHEEMVKVVTAELARVRQFASKSQPSFQ